MGRSSECLAGERFSLATKVVKTPCADGLMFFPDWRVIIDSDSSRGFGEGHWLRIAVVADKAFVRTRMHC